MGLLAETKSRRKINHDPNNTRWTRDTNTFGQKILRAQGWQPGEYLGAQNAPHSELHTAANASYIRVSLKDDMNGLGFNKRPAEFTGLAEFGDILSRLNGKSDAAVQKDKEERATFQMNAYVQSKFGPMRFVRGGLLVGDEMKFDEDDAASAKSSDEESSTAADTQAENKKAEKAQKQSKKRKAASLEDEDTSSAKDSDSKKKRRKEEKKSKKRSSESSSDDDDEGKKSKSKSKKEKRSKSSKKDKSKQDESEQDSAQEDSGSDSEPSKSKKSKKERKEEKRAKKEKKEKKKLKKEEKKRKKQEGESSTAAASADTTAQTTPAGSGTSTPQRYNPRGVRSRFMAAKREAFTNEDSIKKIWMIRA